MASHPRASFPLPPPGLQEVARISGRAGMQRQATGWPSGPVSTLKRMDLTSHTTVFRPGKSPKMKTLEAITPCWHIGRSAALLAPTLLLPFSSPCFQPQSLRTSHLPFSIPPLLLHRLWSYQMSPRAKAITSFDPRHPFLQQQKMPNRHIFPDSSQTLPWLLPSAASAHSSGRRPSLCQWGLFPAGPMPGPLMEPKTPNTAAVVGTVHLLMNSEQHFTGILYSLKLYSSCLCFFPDWRKGLNITVSWNESQINFHFPKDRFSPRQVVEICNSLLKRGSFTSGQYHVLSGCHQRSWKVAYS